MVKTAGYSQFFTIAVKYSLHRINRVAWATSINVVPSGVFREATAWNIVQLVAQPFSTVYHKREQDGFHRSTGGLRPGRHDDLDLPWVD